MTRDEFLSRFGTVFENRPDLAAEAWGRAYDLAAGLAGVSGAARGDGQRSNGLGRLRKT